MIPAERVRESETARRDILHRYKAGESVNEIRRATGYTMWTVRSAVLSEPGLMRGKGRPSITPEEIARLKKVGLTCVTWDDYRDKTGRTNPRLDFRLGVRLLCWRCRERPESNGTPRRVMVEGRWHPLCGPCRRVVKESKRRGHK